MQSRMLALAAALCTVAPAAHAADHGRFQHVFLIVMENHGTGQILGNVVDAPFTNQLAQHAGVAMNYFGVTHPSLPNYLALLSGTFQGIWDDCKAGPAVTCAPEEFVPGAGDATDGAYLTPAQVASASAQAHWFGGKTLVDQLEDRGLSWKAYMQSMPPGAHDVEYAPVVAGTTVKLYAQKHNPFEYFSGVRASPARLARIVPFETDFLADLAAGSAPALAWISPDQCHDMHGMAPSGAALLGLPECGYPAAGLDHGAINLGDQFLRDTVRAIMSSPAWHERSRDCRRVGRGRLRRLRRRETEPHRKRLRPRRGSRTAPGGDLHLAGRFGHLEGGQPLRAPRDPAGPVGPWLPGEHLLALRSRPAAGAVRGAVTGRGRW